VGAQPREGDPFQLEGGREVLEVDVVEWEASRASATPMRPQYFVVRTRTGDRYVLVPLDEPVLDVRWQGIPLRSSTSSA
jgi:hypothetical protein